MKQGLPLRNVPVPLTRSERRCKLCKVGEAAKEECWKRWKMSQAIAKAEKNLLFKYKSIKNRAPEEHRRDALSRAFPGHRVDLTLRR